MAGLLWYRSYMDSLANTSGYYPDIRAGQADFVIEITLESPYLIRAVPSGYNQLELSQIIGGTTVVEGTLQSVEATAHVTVGKNLFGYTLSDFANGTSYGLSTYLEMQVPPGRYTISTDAPTGFIWGGREVGNNYVRVYNGTPHTFNVAQGQTLLIGIASNDMEAALAYHTQIERSNSVTAYEPYTATTYPLANITLRGITETVDGVLSYDGDTYEPDGTVTRYYGERAYQAGDENLTDVVTDGTNTVYKLTTPVTESANPYTATQTVEEGGTVQFVTSNNIPVGNVSIYRRV